MSEIPIEDQIINEEDLYKPNFYKEFIQKLLSQNTNVFPSSELQSKLESKSDLEKILIITQELFNNKIEKKRFSNEMTIKIFDEYEETRDEIISAIFQNCNFDVGFMDDFLNTNFFCLIDINFTKCAFESGDIRALEQVDHCFLQRLTFCQCDLDLSQIDDIFNLKIDTLTELLIDPMQQVEIEVEKLEIAIKGAIVNQLTYLRFSAFNWGKEHYEVILGGFFKNLQTLILDFSDFDDALAKVFFNELISLNNFKSLECFEFGCSSREIYQNFTDTPLIRLKEIHINFPYQLYLVAIGNQLKGIESIDMQRMRVSLEEDKGIRTWFELAHGYFPNLKKVFFPKDFNGEDLQNLVNANTVNLERLTFKDNLNLGRKGIEALVNSSWDIQELNFINCGLTDDDFKILFNGGLKQLRKLSILDNFIGEAAMKALCGSEDLKFSLEYLVFEGNELKDNVVEILANNKLLNLKSLIIRSNKKVSSTSRQLLENVYESAFDFD